MSSEPTVVTGDRFTVSSNTETEEQIREAIEEPDPIKEAASELGKKGGEASATKRAERKAKQETDPEPDEPEPEPEKLGKPRHDRQARMLEAIREKNEIKVEAEKAKAEAEAARREAAQHRAELEALKAPKQPEAPPKQAKPVDPGKPKPENFETHEEWIEALTEYKADQKFRERDEAQAFETAVVTYKSQIDKEMGEVIGGMKEYEATDPGWAERLSDDVRQLRTRPSFIKLRNEKGEYVEPLTPDNVICDEVFRSRANGPKVLLYLTDHPDELQRLRSLESRIDLQVEMRMLAKSLNGAVTAGAAPRARVSKAAAPVQPVTGAANTASPDELDDEASLSEFVRRGRLRGASSQR